MYSEALRIMDENTVNFMIDKLKSTISQKDTALAEKDVTISEMASEMEKILEKLTRYKNQE